MSQKYPYTNTGDDFLSHQDMYADSYPRQSNTYKPSIRSSSQEQTRSTTSTNRPVDSPVNLPGKALSFLHSCGLDSSDLAHLAELPEHLITVETLPKLLLQVKERKLSSTSSSRPSTSQPLDDTSACTWEGSSHPTPVEYPIERPVHPVYPLPPEQVQAWQDRWGNPRRTSSLTTGISCSSSKGSSVPDYSISTASPYCSTTESPEPSSHSFVDSGPRPLLSLRLEPPVVAPTKKEASDFNCKVPPAFPHVCHLCDISIHSTRDWLFHVRGSEHAKTQLELVKKYPKWDQTVESARNESVEAYKVPTRKEASDFNGVVPPVFPYLCVLCNITVFSEKDWSAHVTSGQHAQSQLDLMAKYPVWDGTVRSSRRNDGQASTDMRDGTSKGNTSQMSKEKDEQCSRVVSFTPLPVGEGITSELTAIAKRFGSVKKSLFLPNQGYVEMTCLAEAKKLVEHYSANRLKLKGKLIQVAYSYEYNSLREAEGNDVKQSWGSQTQRRSSPGIRSIQRDPSSPRSIRSSKKTPSSPKKRHSSERTHPSPNRRHSSERTRSSPNRRHSSERTRSSPNRRHSSERTRSSPNRRHPSDTTRSSTKRKHSAERTHSNTRRKHSSERTYSSPKRRHTTERTHTSPKTRYSSEKTHSSRSCHVKEGEDSVKFMESTSFSSSSTVKAETPNKSADTEEKNSVSNKNIESMDSDSDLEGLEVIADDGEELEHDIDDYEPTTSDQENLPSEPMDVTDIHTEEELNTGDSPHSDTSETSNCLKEDQKIDKHKEQEIKEDDHDIPQILEYCVTLDEFTEENLSDCQESDEAKPSILQTEESSEELTTSTNPVSCIKQSEPESPTEEPESPPGESELPRRESESPTRESESLRRESESPTGKPESPTEEPESSTEEPETLPREPESPTGEPESPTGEPESPTGEPESPTEECTSKTITEPNTSENLEDAAFQSKHEHDTEGLTDDVKENFGKVLEVRNLPSAEDYTDLDFLNIIKRYGDIIHHVLFRSCKKGFIEMSLASDAERVAADSKNQDIALRGKVLKIKVSEKYCHLPEDGCYDGSDSDGDEIIKEDISKESNNKQQVDELNGNTDSSNEFLKTDEPVGTEFVRPVVGYFCNLCNIIYATEEEAKDEHCKSPSHREKVKEHKKKSGSVKNKK